VRLMLTLTPVVCVCAGIAISSVFDTYMDPTVWTSPKDAKGEASTTPASGTSRKGEKADKAVAESKKAPVPPKGTYFGILNFDTRILVIVNFALFLFIFVLHCTWVTSNAYSSPSVVLASRNQDGSQNIIDDFREAYYWLRKNTKEDARIMSWWDYGYQIAGFSERTTLVDNNTWNNTHIATVGKAMSTSEEVSYDIMKKHDVDYVLVIFGGLLGYSGDDINKFPWMIRIAEGVYPNDVKESNFFTSSGEYRVDELATPTMKSSLMYKMSYYKFADLFGGRPTDRVRNVQLPAQGPSISVVEEAFTSENWIVRIYKVKDYDLLGRNLEQAQAFEEGKKKRARRKKGKKN